MPVQSKSYYKLAIGLTLTAACLLIWLSLGVGIIGQDGDPANWLYAAVIVASIIGACLARLKAIGMARTLLVMAAIQILITVIALALRLGQPWSGPLELIALNGFFIAIFLTAAWSFHRAGRQRVPPGP